MKKVYIFWMILGALALGIVILLFVKGEAIAKLLQPRDDSEELFEKG